MAPRRTKFCKSWLKKLDDNGTLVSEWAKENEKDIHGCICTWCSNITELNLDVSTGFIRLRQHSRTEKHKKNAKGKKSK